MRGAMEPGSRRLITAIAAGVMIVLAALSLTLPWYVVGSPESPSRDGLLINFYVDHIEMFRIENGSVWPSERLSYESPQAASIGMLFGTVFVLEGLVALAALLLMTTTIVLKVVPRRGYIVKRVLLTTMIFGNWAVVVLFMVMLPTAMQAMQEWPSGFFATQDIDWAGVVQTYGPGSGWLISFASAALAVVVAIAEWTRRVSADEVKIGADGP